MGTRVAVTLADIKGFMAGLANTIGNRDGHLLGAECTISIKWDGKWKVVSVELWGENNAWNFFGMRRKHYDGRIRGRFWDFDGDRDAFVRWDFMLEAMRSASWWSRSRTQVETRHEPHLVVEEEEQ
jgi:hypothetical protein